MSYLLEAFQRRHNQLPDAESVWYPLKSTQTKFIEESTSLLNLCTTPWKWGVATPPLESRRRCQKLQETRVYICCKKVATRSSLPKHSNIPWVVSGILSVSGPLEDDPDNLQRDSRRTTAIQKRLHASMGESDKSGHHVDSWKIQRCSENNVQRWLIKDKGTPTSLHRKGLDNESLICNYALNSETSANNGVMSVELRRHRHRLCQRLGGIRNTGKVLNCGESGKWASTGKVSTLSDSWTGFTKFTLLSEKPLPRFLWRLTRIQATTRPDYLWPEIWIGMSEAVKNQEKQECAIEKTKARQC